MGVERMEGEGTYRRKENEGGKDTGQSAIFGRGLGYALAGETVTSHCRLCIRVNGRRLSLMRKNEDKHHLPADYDLTWPLLPCRRPLGTAVNILQKALQQDSCIRTIGSQVKGKRLCGFFICAATKLCA